MIGSDDLVGGRTRLYANAPVVYQHKAMICNGTGQTVIYEALPGLCKKRITVSHVTPRVKYAYASLNLCQEREC
jgi:hypothetical protein